MAESNVDNDLPRANFRLCRLCVWPNYVGLGFNLENAIQPPHIIRTVESNSPAAAGGLKILDLVLAVNNQDVSQADYQTVTQAIKNARDSNSRIELLVIEKRFYESLKTRGASFNPQLAKIIDTPITMPRDYMNFPKYTPRTCEIRLSPTDQTFGFEVVNGAKETGAFIQEVVPNSPASRTSLRKSDRVLEIDDKFVDNEPSKLILDRLFKAKKKRSVKLYVVDTNTYKHFQDNKIPLPSKDFRRSKFARQQQPSTSTYINVADISTEPKSADVDIPRPIFPIPTLRDGQQINRSESLSTQEPHQDDIRLCTITRANATDTYGLELVYHRRDLYHSLKLTPGRDNLPSNAALAGIKSNDHLIEVNGENIENMNHEQVQQRMHAIRYPQALQVLVADSATYNEYKRQNKVIHSGLLTVQKLPENIIEQSTSTLSQYVVRAIPTVKPLPVEDPSSGIAGLVNSSLTQSRISIESSQSNRRQYQLQRIPGFAGYGFSVNSNQAGHKAHKITQIAPHSPAAEQGLRVGDYIITVNDKNVEKMSALDFNQFLRTSAQNAETHGNPLLLEVMNEDSYESLGATDTSIARRSTPDPSPAITSINGNLIRQPSYTRPVESISAIDKSSKSTSRTQRTPSLNSSRKSSATQPRISRDGSQKLPPATQSITSRDEPPKLTINQPTSSPNDNRQLPINQPYMNGYDSSPHDLYSRPKVRSNETPTSSLYRSRGHLSRGAVDVVSKNRLLRYCRLITGAGQPFGFQLKPDNNNHIVYNIQLDSPAARAGLSENDRLIEIDDQDIERKSNKEVAHLIRNAVHSGTLRLLIAPNNVKVLSKRSAKSLSLLNDDRSYRSKYNDQEQSLTGRSRSVPRLNSEQNHSSSEPTEPLPRKCVLQRDPSFRGCGFRLIEKENCDTPIIIEISPHSPAKRSGLTEGDHIIYVESQNVQNFHSFNDITSLIQRRFEDNGEITLVTLTDLAYQVLKRRGGYLESLAFDYQSSTIDQLKPRLCKLKLSNYQRDFGFTLHRTEYLCIKNIEPNSPADIHELKKGDIVLELNGRSAKDLTINQIKEITETSKQDRKLDILVIDIDGYRYSIKHAIPLNSLLSFVQTDEHATTTNNRNQQEPVYL